MTSTPWNGNSWGVGDLKQKCHLPGGGGGVWIIQIVRCCRKYSGVESERTVSKFRKEKKRNLFSFVHVLHKGGT